MPTKENLSRRAYWYRQQRNVTPTSAMEVITKVEMRIDTGCFCTIVRSDLVPNYLLKKKLVVMAVADRRVEQWTFLWPWKVLSMHSRLQQLVVPVLLGRDLPLLTICPEKLEEALTAKREGKGQLISAGSDEKSGQKASGGG